VFYMSAAQIDNIAAQLARHGMSASQPVALLERATWPDERVLRSTLGELPALARGAQLKSPSLLIIGEVAALAQAKSLGTAAEPGVVAAQAGKQGS
jgi:siroheme synthase